MIIFTSLFIFKLQTYNPSTQITPTIKIIKIIKKIKIIKIIKYFDVSFIASKRHELENKNLIQYNYIFFEYFLIVTIKHL